MNHHVDEAVTNVDMQLSNTVIILVRYATYHSCKICNLKVTNIIQYCCVRTVDVVAF